MEKFLNFKKGIRSILSIVLIFVTLVSCSNSKKDNKENEDSKFTKTNVYAPIDEILKADLFSRKVQINDTVITLPCKLSELEKVATLIKETSEEDYKSYSFELKNGSEISCNGKLYLLDKNKEEVYINSISVSDEINENIYFPKNIKIGMSKKECEDIMNENNAYKRNETWSISYFEDAFDTKLLNSTVISSYDEMPVGSNFSIKYDKETEKIVRVEFNAVPHVEDDVTFYNRLKHTKNVLTLPLPISIIDNSSYAILRYNKQNYVMVYYHRNTFGAADVSKKKIVEQISEFNPKIQYENEKVCLATGFNSNYLDIAGTFTIDGYETINYEIYSSYISYGFARYIGCDQCDIFAIDGGEVPKEVKAIFQNVINTASKNISY